MIEAKTDPNRLYQEISLDRFFQISSLKQWNCGASDVPDDQTAIERFRFYCLYHTEASTFDVVGSVLASWHVEVLHRLPGLRGSVLVSRSVEVLRHS